MSTKNIARSALEPGRLNSFKSDAKSAKDSYRRQERDFLAKALVDPETDEDIFREHVPKKGRQGDNLGPIKRFIASQVGRPWSKVWSEINEKFGADTLAGRHIMEHITSYVGGITEERELEYWHPPFRLSNGILTHNKANKEAKRARKRWRDYDKKVKEFFKKYPYIIRDHIGYLFWTDIFSMYAKKLAPLTIEEASIFLSFNLNTRSWHCPQDKIRSLVEEAKAGRDMIVSSWGYQWGFGAESLRNIAEIILGRRGGVIPKGIPDK